MSLFQTYAATEGLERFPDEQRFRVWRNAHKKLMQDNADYRWRYYRFAATICALSILLGPIMTIPSCLTDENVAIEIAVDVLAILVFVPTVVVLSFRQQRWANAKVAEELKKLPPRDNRGLQDS